MVFPVSGVMPSMVRMISNWNLEEMSLAFISYSGDSSSAIGIIGNNGHTNFKAKLINKIEHRMLRKHLSHVDKS